VQKLVAMDIADPLMGCPDSWRPTDIVSAPLTAHDPPLLYHHGSSYYGCIARLALEEKQIRWTSRGLDVHGLEHFSPFYMAISPTVTTPLLVHTEGIYADSLALIKFVDGHYPGPEMTPKDPKALAAMNQFIQMHYSFGMEELSFGKIAAGVENLSYGVIVKSRLGSYLKKSQLHEGIKKLEALMPELPAAGRKVAQNKIELSYHRLQNINNAAAVASKAEKGACEILDHLEGMLAEGPFVTGPSYTLADVIATLFVARCYWNANVKVYMSSLPRVMAYLELVKKRPSWKSADVWDAPRAEVMVAFITNELLRLLPVLFACAILIGIMFALRYSF
jgi:glutathione S-transferase